MNRGVLFFVVGFGDLGVGEDLGFADYVGVVGEVDHGEAALAQLVLEGVLSGADLDAVPFEFHPLII